MNFQSEKIIQKFYKAIETSENQEIDQFSMSIVLTNCYGAVSILLI